MDKTYTFGGIDKICTFSGMDKTCTFSGMDKTCTFSEMDKTCTFSGMNIHGLTTNCANTNIQTQREWVMFGSSVH